MEKAEVASHGYNIICVIFAGSIVYFDFSDYSEVNIRNCNDNIMGLKKQTIWLKMEKQ